MNIGQLIVTLGVDATQLEKATKQLQMWTTKANRTLTTLQNNLYRQGMALERFGRYWSVYVTAPIIAAGVASFKMYSDFEFNMTKIVSLVGVAREQMETWSKDVLKMAPELGRSPKELSEALYFITSAGIRGAAALDVLRASAMGAAIGLGETKVVADLVTSAVNAYGSEMLSAEHATDILIATVREGKTETDALASTMGKVLPIASALGVEFDQVGAAIASMTRTGTPAATAAIQLRQIFNSILKTAANTGNAASQALHTMHTSGMELVKMMRDQGLLAMFMKLKSLSDEYGTTVLGKVIPNIRSLSGVLDILGANLEYNKQIFDSLANSTGDLKKALEEVQKTMKFGLNQASAALNVLLIEIGEVMKDMILPKLADFIVKVGKLTVKIDELSEAKKRMIGHAVEFVAVLGPATLGIGLMETALSGLVKVLRRTAGALGDVFMFMGKNPKIIGFGSLIIALGAAVLKYKNFIHVATAEQLEFNKAVEETFRMQTNMQSIEDTMGKISSMSKEELGSLLERINIQLDVEKVHTNNLLEEEKKRNKNVLNAEQIHNYIAEVNAGIRDKNAISNAEFMAALDIQILDAEKENNQKRIAELTSFAKIVKNIYDKIGLDEDEAKRTEEIASVYSKLKDRLAAINTEYKLLYDPIEQVKETTSAYEQATHSLTNLQVNETDPALASLTAKFLFLSGIMEQMTDKTKSVEDVIRDMNKELAYSAMIESARGDAYDYLGAKMNIYEGTLKTLMTDYEDNADAIANLISLMKSLQEQIDATNVSVDKNVSYVYDDLARSLASVAFSLGEMIVLIDQANGSFEKMGMAALSVVETVLQSIYRIIEALLIEAITAMFAKEALKIGIGALITGAIGAGIMLSMIEGYKSRASASAQGMQHGGVVPPGYPNDSYPAMLTSGEKVLPPNQVSRSQQVVIEPRMIHIPGRGIYIEFNRAKREMESIGT